MLSVRKDIIKLAHVIISDHILKKIYCLSSANTGNVSVCRIHITKSKVAQIICTSNVNTLLTCVVESHVLNAY
jgi:hypothetical protein